MIGSLNGKVSYYNDRYALIEIGGVGYKVLIGKNILSRIKEIGQSIKLFTYTYVREDVLDLYGFLTLEDLQLFEQLIAVSGIGPKTAMAIFSVGTGKEIENAIMEANLDFFGDVPRLGRKNSQKIIIELKNKLGAIKELDLHESDFKENKDLVEALKTFGFSSRESEAALKAIRGQGITMTDKVRLALKYLGK